MCGSHLADIYSVKTRETVSDKRVVFVCATFLRIYVESIPRNFLIGLMLVHEEVEER